MSDAEFNPYAAPQADLTPQPPLEGNLWQQGRLLIVRRDAVFPDRCIKCNAPAESYRVTQKLTWGSWLMVLPRSITIEFGLCPEHARRLRRVKAIAWLGWLAGTAAIVGGLGLFGTHSSALTLAGYAVISAAGLWYWLAGHTFSPRHIAPWFATLSGAGPEFLAELPSWDGQL
jgi:hypothetical protein